MKTIVSIYNDHAHALDAVKLLKDAGFSSKHISLLGTAYEDKELSDTATDMKIATRGVGIGAVAGSTIGLLSGLGLMAVPGLGFIFGIGALAGAVAGFDFGIIGGGLISALAIKGLNKKEVEEKYQEELNAGKILLVFQGDATESNKAKDVLETHGIHTEMAVHDH